ncbi:MAG: hypothetical protein KatS3mg102_0040 [Planctomycetota bacterium]|nr:MAG: hypothetical protein KatS3mg102_0040 [Planctomycetota bacterium]
MLMIEDNPADADLVRLALAEARGEAFRFEHRERLAAGLELLERERPDAVLLDLHLPDSAGVQTLRTLLQRAPGLPVVVWTEADDEASALQALQLGAQDYLVKGHVDLRLLPRALRFAIERCRARGLHGAAPAAGTARTEQACVGCGGPLPEHAPLCPACGTLRPLRPLAPGTLVAGHYEVLEPIGHGGFATVYKVRHTVLGEVFALKVLQPWLVADPEQRRRFLREARLGARLNHPNLVVYREFGLEQGVPFVAMDYVPGPTLAAVLAAGRLPARRAVAIARGILAGLAAAHAAGIVHRDLKPSNVVLEPVAGGQERVRVLDLGLAKLIGESTSPRSPPEAELPTTRPGVLFGTVDYMAPEQATGGPVDGRADLYSCGAIIYEMLTGAPPFGAGAGSIYEVMWRNLHQVPLAPSARCPDAWIPEELDRACLRALAKRPEERFASADAFDRALAALQSERFPGLLRGEEPLAFRPGLVRRAAVRLRRAAGAVARRMGRWWRQRYG